MKTCKPHTYISCMLYKMNTDMCTYQHICIYICKRKNINNRVALCMDIQSCRHIYKYQTYTKTQTDTLTKHDNRHMHRMYTNNKQDRATRINTNTYRHTLSVAPYTNSCVAIALLQHVHVTVDAHAELKRVEGHRTTHVIWT